MKKFNYVLLIVGVILMVSGNTFAQTVKGIVKGDARKEALVGATVSIKGTTKGASTDTRGHFVLDIAAGSQILEFRYVGYKSKSIEVALSKNETKDLGTIYLEQAAVGLDGINIVADRAKARQTPVAISNVEKEDIENKLGSRDIPLVLNTTPSVYATQQGGGAGDARINVRGFSQRNVAIMINGVPVNDMENGWVYWSNWDGVGDASSSIQIQRGLSAVNLAVPSIGGTINIITDPAQQEQSVNYKQEFGSGQFMKSTLMAHTGLINDKYAFSVGGVRKTGNGVIDGTWSDAYAYYFGASYNINPNNRLELYALGAPQRHGQNLYKQNIAAYSQSFADGLDSYEEEAELAYPESSRGRLYNQNWNYVSKYYNEQQWWNGQAHTRFSEDFINERENFYNKPQVNLNWYTQWAENLTQYTILYYSGGTGGGTGTYGDIQWDYSGPSRIADWDATIERNRMHEADTALGILRNSRNNQWTIGGISKLKWKISDKITTNFGIDWRTAEIDHFREVRDLLGGKYWIKTADAFNPNEKIGLGDKMAYNFTNTVDWIGAYGQAEYSDDGFSLYGMAGFSGIKYNYENHFAKEEGTENPLTAESDFITGGQVKGGANYNLSETFNIFANAGYVSKVPIFDNVISDRDGSKSEDPENEKFLSFELGTQYLSLSQTFNLKANAYFTQWQDRSNNVGVVNQDGSEGYIFLQGMDQRHMGVEFEGAWQPVDYFRLDVAASHGDWIHTDDVSGTYKDYEGGGANDVEFNYYVKDLKVGNAPQSQLAISATVEPLKDLRAEVVMKSFTNHYADWDPFSRTELEDGQRPQSWEAPGYTVFDLHAFYDLPVKNKDFKIQIFAHVFNLTDEIYIQDATDNSRYNGFDGDHDADDAEVFLGIPRTINFGVSATF